MSFNQYLQKEIRLIERYRDQLGVSIDEACIMWVKEGLAQRFAMQYRVMLEK